jgi:hypothetical protein
MFLGCCRGEHGNGEVYVGSSKGDWQGLPAIGQIRKADRDHSLQTNIPLALRAYNALQEIEEKSRSSKFYGQPG